MRRTTSKSFSEMLTLRLMGQKERVGKNKASMIIIDGGLGDGKTTLAVEVADAYQGGPIDLSKQYGMGGIQFQERLHQCYIEKLPVVIYDEAGDFAKRGAITDFNRQLNRIFETYRGFRICVILCLPCMDILDSTIFKNKVPRILINCYGRKESYGNFRVYSLYRMFWLKRIMDQIVVKPEAYMKVKPNFYGHFWDLPPDRARELEALTLKGKEKIVLEQTIRAMNLITVGGIAAALNRSEVWVRMRITQRKVKPTKVFKKKYYYDRNLMERLV
jgi:hypothetical protein